MSNKVRRVTDAQRRKIIEACGRNYGAAISGAPIKIQQKMYKAFEKAVADLSEKDCELAMSLGREWWNKKAMRGAGVDW